MKLQKLTIHNIASIEYAEIDFDGSTLSNSEVFLITGKTGSGKSTILDAICLALYATTPRMRGTNMDGETKDGKEDVTLKDPRQLMRRNTVEASATLTFVGNDGVHYGAKWYVKRAHKKITGSLQDKVWTLTNLDDGKTLNKVADVSAKITEAIGLDFNQFCRTTMLAQGEFTRFLNSKDNDKAEILEKITGVDLYRKIGAKIYEVTSQKEKELSMAKSLVENTKTLTEDEIAEKKTNLEALEKRFQELKSENDENTKKKKWLEDDINLAKDVEDSKNSLSAAQQVVESSKFKENESLVKEWNDTIDARQWLRDIKMAENDLVLKQSELDSLKNKFYALLEGQLFNGQTLSAIEKSIKEIDDFLNQEADNANVYDKVQTIVAALKRVIDGRSAILRNRQQIAQKQDILGKELQPKLDSAKIKEESEKAAVEEMKADISKKEAELESLGLPTLRDQSSALLRLLTNINNAREKVGTFFNAKKQREAKRKELDQRHSDLDNKKVELEKMSAPIEEAKKQVEEKDQCFQAQKDTVDTFAATLRAKLQIGDTCPVCRQRIESALPNEEDLKKLVSDLQKELDTAEQELKGLTDKRHELEATIKAETDALSRDEKAFEQDATIELQSKAIGLCKSFGIERLDDNTLPQLDSLEKENAKKKLDIDNSISDGDAIQRNVDKMRKDLENKRKIFEDIKNMTLAAKDAITKCSGDINTLETLIKTKESDINAAIDDVKGFVPDGLFGIDWINSPKEFSETLDSAAKKYYDSQKDKQKLQSEYDRLKSVTDGVSQTIKSIINDVQDWETLEPKTGCEMKDIQESANEISRMVTAILTQKTSDETLIDDKKRQLNLFFSNNEAIKEDRLAELLEYTPEAIRQTDEVIKSSKNEVLTKKTLHHASVKRMEEHTLQRPQMNEDDTIESLQRRIGEIEQSINEISEQKGAINQELATNEENKRKLGALMEDVGKKKAEFDKWNRMQQFIGDSTGNKFCKIAQSYVLATLINSANHYMKTLTDRYLLKVTPGTFIISLEDAYQGYVSRAASTISGGESFLVSLSLALALSDIGQTMSVDTLFIDEGFGTLSGEPLQNAISTLRSLHNKSGRHVGIISHVEELQERIPVQIQVVQENNSSSSKVQIITK
jgi:exonuclease SbcC